MTCNDSNLSAYLDGELPAAERRAVEAHLKTCPDCAAALKDLERVRTMLLTQAIPMGLHVPVVERIRKEELRRTTGVRRLVWAIAAMLLIALAATAAYRMLTPGEPEPSNQQVAAPITMDQKPDVPSQLARAPQGTEEQPVEATPSVSLAETDLPLTLSGTVTGENPLAIIVTGDDAGQRIFRPGDSVLPGVVLKEVGNGRALLDNNGVMQTLTKGTSEVQRPSVTGRWQMALLRSDKVEDYGPVVEFEDAGSSITITEPKEGITFIAALSGRHMTVDGTPGDLPADLVGDFNEAFTEVTLSSPTLAGWPQSEQAVTPQNLYKIRLTKVDENNPEMEPGAILAMRQDEVQAMYEPLKRYADAHGRRFPDALTQLIPDYVQNLDLYANRDGRTVAYVPGNEFLDLRAIPGLPSCSNKSDVTSALLNHEAELQEVWGGPAPIVPTLVEVTYQDPDYVFTLNVHGAVSGHSAHPALQEDGDNPVVALGKYRAQIASDQNNLKQLGLVMYMFANENCDYMFPGWCSVYPEYLTDVNVLTSPWEEPGTLSYVIFFPGESFESLRAMGAENVIANNPNADPESPVFNGQVESQVPVMCNARDIPAVAGDPVTRNVLFLDGHVERLKMDEWSERVKPYMP
ncbi:MAG: zf-HC2 domain-containing protein [Candidatus Hydrogenedentes bacterium]|nr:zf-HC2 domain-containing protein [Candidatus Hydrogenedentota bacterium]